MDDATNMDEATIRENLKKARNTLGYTQAQMAESLDISVTAYQKIESGKTRIINRNFSKCADSLGMTLPELVVGFKPVRDPEAELAEARQSYELKTKVLESRYINEILQMEKEIGRLKEAIADKDETIATQKLLIDRLMPKPKA